MKKFLNKWLSSTPIPTQEPEPKRILRLPNHSLYEPHLKVVLEDHSQENLQKTRGRFEFREGHESL